LPLGRRVLPVWRLSKRLKPPEKQLASVPENLAGAPPLPQRNLPLPGIVIAMTRRTRITATKKTKRTRKMPKKQKKRMND